MLGRKKIEKESRLEQLCPIASECSESDYGSLDKCKGGYVDCKRFNIYVKDHLEKFERLKSDKC